MREVHKKPLVLLAILAALALMATPSLGGFAFAQEETSGEEVTDTPADEAEDNAELEDEESDTEDETEFDTEDETEFDTEDETEFETEDETESETEDETESEDDADAFGTDISGIEENVSLDLRLRSVDVHEVDLDDEEDEIVRFCFNNDVIEINDESRFGLIGADSDNTNQATSVELLQDRSECVLAHFDDGTDVLTYAVGAVGAAAVTNRDGEGNLPDSEEIAGAIEAEVGQTIGPDLVSVHREPSLNRVEYTFDEELSEDGAEGASEFGFYVNNGDAFLSDELVSTEDNTAVVEFSDEEGELIEEAVRFFALTGAVTDRNDNESHLSSIAQDRTTDPTLTDAERVGDNQVDFEFSESIADPDSSRFFVLTDDLDAFSGEDADLPSDDTVRVTFGEDIDEVSDSLVVAIVSGGAVQANDGSGDDNTVNDKPLGSSARQAGNTSGPDLINASIVDEDTGEVTLTFDEQLEQDVSGAAEDEDEAEDEADGETDGEADGEADDEAAAGAEAEEVQADIEESEIEEDGQLSVDPSDFFVVTSSGRLIAAGTLVDVEGNEITITFDPDDVKSAEAVTIASNAITDAQGNGNPLNTVDL